MTRPSYDSNDVVFEWDGGYREEYLNGRLFRGVSYEGKRPSVAYMDMENIDPATKFEIVAAMNIAILMFRDMYDNTDKYLEYNGTLIQLVKHRIHDDLCIKQGDATLVYQEELDGRYMKEDEARDKYPEYFI